MISYEHSTISKINQLIVIDYFHGLIIGIRILNRINYSEKNIIWGFRFKSLVLDALSTIFEPVYYEKMPSNQRILS